MYGDEGWPESEAELQRRENDELRHVTVSLMDALGVREHHVSEAMMDGCNSKNLKLSHGPGGMVAKMETANCGS